MAEAPAAVMVARRPFPAGRHDRLFYSGMAIVMLVTVFVGFAPKYYLSGYFEGPRLVPLTHLHAILFTGWVLLFLTQTSLVATGRVAVHRRLGIAGAVLAASMVVVGVSTAISAAARGGGTTAPPDVPPLVFLAVPLGDMVLFALLVASALWLRRNREAHKRLMLLAYISILTAAIARLPGVEPLGPLGFFAFTDLFIVAGVAYDYFSRRRVHRAYIYGGLLIVLSQPLRLIVAGTDAWMRFATFLTS
jgi:uncharacterized membrane protein YozB (DUF420 family)